MALSNQQLLAIFEADQVRMLDRNRNAIDVHTAELLTSPHESFVRILLAVSVDVVPAYTKPVFSKMNSVPSRRVQFCGYICVRASTLINYHVFDSATRRALYGTLVSRIRFGAYRIHTQSEESIFRARGPSTSSSLHTRGSRTRARCRAVHSQVIDNRHYVPARRATSLLCRVCAPVRYDFR